jgi:aminoglycoside phosphotransferase (APT) family kinase protein
MPLDDPDLQEFSAIVGAQVLAAEPCRWGFENRTAIVTLADGRHLVVQRIASRTLASHKIRLARILPERLAAAGLRAPCLLAADATADPPYAVREYLPGDLAASLMGTVPGAIHVARAMGALLPRLAAVPTVGAALHSSWADPPRLVRQAQQQIERCRALLNDATIAALNATIAETPARFAGRPASFAHGDFCPVNALIQADEGPFDAAQDKRRTKDEDGVVRPDEAPISKVQIVGLLDLEFARIADPLFDTAWWGWVVRYHHPERWVHAWPDLLAAAGITPDEATLGRVRVLQRLRCLELVDYYARTRPPAVTAMWAERLRDTIAWNSAL